MGRQIVLIMVSLHTTKRAPESFSRFIVPSGDQEVEQWIIEACKMEKKQWRRDLGVPANKIPNIPKHLREQETCEDSIRMIHLIHRIQLPLGHGGHGAGGDSTGGEKPRESNLDWWNLPPWQNQTKWSWAGTAGRSLQNGQLETSVARIFSWAGRAHKCTSQHLKECEVLTGTFSCPLHLVSTAELIEVPFSETFPKMMLNQIVLYFNTKQWEVSLGIIQAPCAEHIFFTRWIWEPRSGYVRFFAHEDRNI